MPRHRLRRLALHVNVDLEETAFALQSQLDDLRRIRLPTLVEKALSSHDRPGLHLRLDCLEVHLGDLTPADFPDAFERKLDEALHTALAQAVSALPPPEDTATTKQPRTLHPLQARQQILTYYLLNGTLPYWASAQASVGSLLRPLLTGTSTEQRALAAAIRAAGPRQHVLRRLILQLDPPQRAALLCLLDPTNAAAMLFYIDELQALERAVPFPPVSGDTLPHLIWTLSFAFALQAHTSDFSRLRFLAYQVQGIAAAAGIPYYTILARLHGALPRTAARHPLQSGLLATLRELFAEHGLSAAQPHPTPSSTLLDLASQAATVLEPRHTLFGEAPPSESPSESGTNVSQDDAATPLLSLEPLQAILFGIGKVSTSASQSATPRSLHFPHEQKAGSNDSQTSMPHTVPPLPQDRTAPHDRTASTPLAHSQESLADLAPPPLQFQHPARYDLPGPTDPTAIPPQQNPAGRFDGPGDATLQSPPRQADASVLTSALPPGLDALGNATPQTFVDSHARHRSSAGPSAPTSEHSQPPAQRSALTRSLHHATLLQPGHASAYDALGSPLAALPPDSGQSSRHSSVSPQLLAQVATPSSPGHASPRRNPQDEAGATPTETPSGSIPLAPAALAQLLTRNPAEATALLSVFLPLYQAVGSTGMPRMSVPPSLLAPLGAADPGATPNSARSSAQAQLVGLAAALSETWRATTPGTPPESHLSQSLLALITTPLATLPLGPLLDTIAATLTRSPAAQMRLDTLLEDAIRIADRAGDSSLRLRLTRERRRLSPRPPAPPAVASGSRARTSFSSQNTTPAEPGTDAIYISNAGLVLTNAHLPMLFRQLAFLTDDPGSPPGFTGPTAISRAVHLLQALVDNSTSTPEPQLVLNKILCGVPPSYPILREILPTPHEFDTTRTLLRSILAHWPTLGNTSIAGLQETFLQREGRLHYTERGWHLHVQRKTLDILLDSFHGNKAIVLHRWMPQPVFVTW